MVYNCFMSTILESVKHRPSGLFQMDDTSPLQDYSPNNRTATYTGTPERHPALTHGATYAPILKAGVVASFDCPVFVQGKEADAFALLATFSVIPVGTSAPIQVLGHSGQYDGLVIDGTKVSFSTKYLTSGEAKCTFDIQDLRAVNVMGVHTYSKNILYIDGEVAAEITLTDAQRHDQYIATDGKLYSGQTTSTRGIAVNNIAYYDKSLTQRDSIDIYKESRRVTSSTEVPSMFGGIRLSMSHEIADTFGVATWQTARDWYSGQISNAAVNNNNLVPQFNMDVSRASTWYDTFSLSTGGNPIHGVVLDWDGTGAVVDVSLDASSWVSVTKGVNVSLIPPGFDPTDKELIIRISFPGGITGDTSYVSKLIVTGIKTAVAPTWSGRTVTFNNAYQQKPSEALDFNYNWGAKIASGGTITISPDSNTRGVIARTIELWIRADDSSASLSVAGTYYQDGLPSNAVLPIGQWTLFHVVAAADVTTNIVINGAAQVGQVGLYPTALTASQIAEVSEAYTASNVLKVGDNSPVVVSESPSAVQIYAHNWSILSAG